MSPRARALRGAMLILVAQATAIAWWRIGGSEHRMVPWEGFAPPADWHTFAEHGEGAWMNAAFAVVIVASVVAIALRPMWGLIASLPAIFVAVVGLIAAYLEPPLTELELTPGGRSYLAALEAMIVVGILAATIEVVCLRACASSSQSRSWPRAAAVTRIRRRSPPR